MAVVSLSLAASLLLLIGPSLWSTDKISISHDYTTLSAHQAVQSDRAVLKVVFAKDVSSQAVDDLLTQIQAKSIAPANSMGAITLQLNATSHMTTDQALTLLRSHSAVLLAEPAQP